MSNTQGAGCFASVFLVVGANLLAVICHAGWEALFNVWVPLWPFLAFSFALVVLVHGAMLVQMLRKKGRNE